MIGACVVTRLHVTHVAHVAHVAGAQARRYRGCAMDAMERVTRG